MRDLKLNYSLQNLKEIFWEIWFKNICFISLLLTFSGSMGMATGHIAYLDAVSSAIAVIQTLEFSKKPQDLYLIGAPETVMSS